MQTLTTWQVYLLARISKIAREARQFELANAVFARLLIESVAHHDDWEILWLADKNDPYYDLIALRPLNPNLVTARVPSTLLPMPILKPNVAEMIFGARESEETVVPRQSGHKLENEALYDDQVSKLWNMFFQVVSPEEAIALVIHNFTKPDVDSIVCEIQRRASKLFAVRADWFDELLCMSLSEVCWH